MNMILKVTKILEDLGFPASTQQNLMSTLTGGDKVKILLAQVFISKTRYSIFRWAYK